MAIVVKVERYGNITVCEIKMQIDESVFADHLGTLEEIREAVTSLFHRLNVEASGIINDHPKDPLEIQRKLDGLKGVMIQFGLICETTKRT